MWIFLFLSFKAKQRVALGFESLHSKCLAKQFDRYLPREADDKEHGAAEEDPVFHQHPFHSGDQHAHQRRWLTLLGYNDIETSTRVRNGWLVSPHTCH